MRSVSDPEKGILREVLNVRLRIGNAVIKRDHRLHCNSALRDAGCNQKQTRLTNCELSMCWVSPFRLKEMTPTQGLRPANFGSYPCQGGGARFLNLPAASPALLVA